MILNSLGISFYVSNAIFLIRIFLSVPPEDPPDYERNDNTDVIIKLVSVLDDVIKALEFNPNNSGVSYSGNLNL